jgi:hypothetical protein
VLLLSLLMNTMTADLADAEEKKIPYVMEKINMRCYGDKPASSASPVWPAARHHRTRWQWDHH